MGSFACNFRSPMENKAFVSASPPISLVARTNPKVIMEVGDVMVMTAVRMYVQRYFQRPPLSLQVRHTSKKNTPICINDRYPATFFL